MALTDRELLSKLAVPDDAAEAIVATMPSPTRHPVRWWLLQRACQLLTARLDAGPGSPTDLVSRGWAGWPRVWPPWSRRGEAGHWSYAHLFLAATPVIRRWHTAHGIDDSISWATLQDLGRRIDQYRAKHPGGGAGIDDPRWLFHHFRGRLFQLGRVQFLRGPTARRVAPVDPALEIHIPAGGPLLPAAVDSSFAQARAFFDRHFPADSSRYGVMTSWMLDPQLAEYLPPTSNILAFQRRFHLLPHWHRPGDTAILDALTSLPHPTTLTHAVTTHRQAARHWHIHRGWCPL